MSSVSFDHVTKRFDDVVAVDDLSLEVQDREFMVLLGPSGCGKTTVLRMLAGLDDITSGTVSIGDRVVNDVDPRDRDIAMVFQSYALYPHMTVRRNIESPLVAARSGSSRGSERDRRVADAAETLGLTPYINRRPGALSGGQRQRVALARAIVRRPSVFLMDEPLSNLDAKLRTQTRLELVELWRRLETTFVYVTHDQVEAMTMASRIAILADGLLQQVGEPQAVYERPQNLFVAGFIGSPPMNTAPAAFDRDPTGSGGKARVGSGTVRVLDSGTAVGGTEVVIGVRPEHLRLGGDDLHAIVLNVEQLGHEHHIVCALLGVEGVDPWIVRQPASDQLPAPGEQIALAVDSAAVNLFDPVSTDRCN